jgi:hypothetical protein
MVRTTHPSTPSAVSLLDASEGMPRIGRVRRPLSSPATRSVAVGDGQWCGRRSWPCDRYHDGHHVHTGMFRRRELGRLRVVVAGVFLLAAYLSPTAAATTASASGTPPPPPSKCTPATAWALANTALEGACSLCWFVCAVQRFALYQNAKHPTHTDFRVSHRPFPTQAASCSLEHDCPAGYACIPLAACMRVQALQTCSPSQTLPHSPPPPPTLAHRCPSPAHPYATMGTTELSIMTWFSLTTEALNRSLFVYALPNQAEALLM